MKRSIILATLTLIFTLVTSAQNVPWQITEKLHPIIYPFKIDPKTANAKFNDEGKHSLLTEEYGYVIIPPSAYRQKEDHNGSMGLLVAHLPGDRYCVCELRCARCLYEYKKHNKLTPMKSITPGQVLGFFECKHCGVQLGCFVFTGGTNLDHTGYEGVGIINQESYIVETIKDDYGFIKELRITNPTFMLEHLDREKKSEPTYRHEPTWEECFPHAVKNVFQ